MRSVILPRHFIFSVLLLVGLLGAYIYAETQRLDRELLNQTEQRGASLAEAMAANIRSAFMANALLEDLIGQRLLDNARLIDQLLRTQPADDQLLRQIAALNRLEKIELLDADGNKLKKGPPAPAQERMEEMLERMRQVHGEEFAQERRARMRFMWGRRWQLPQDQGQAPPKVTERKFWEGSVFGVAIGARSFPGIIAVHANADYILNFRKEIDVQKRIEELGRQPDIEHVALLDHGGKVIAHTDVRLIDQHATVPSAEMVSHRSNGRYDIVKTVDVNGSSIGVLEIGLSLAPMEAAWRRSLGSMIIFGVAVLAVGILGMATIFYNQQSHLKKIKTLEAEISRQERLSELGNMAANVAHEIRNPLNSVSIGLQRLRAEFTPTQDAQDYTRFLTLMQEEVRRLNAIVEQFLSLARPLNLIREPIAVAPFLEELHTLMGAEATASRVRIELKVAPELPPLRADRNHLKQLLLNLILNAMQAMPNGGTLTVAAAADGDKLKLSVIDEGTGIKPEALDKIFDPYFTTKTKGSGLGLSIARRIAEAHGGSIVAHSAPERGTRFDVLLPLGTAEI
jgi:signal transduction histidine kinase